ncbi:hypothetical protein [Streptomyces sp. NPDC001020]
MLETRHDTLMAVGRGCEAFHGAPRHGSFFGTFRIESPRGTVRCSAVAYEPSGFAHVPEFVDGRCCERVVR